jgi:hypothetical protein
MSVGSPSPRDDGAIPHWLSKRVFLLKRTGHFTFTGDRSFDPVALSHPRITALLSLVKVLDISHTPITSIAGLPVLPKLNVFVADRTKLDTFANFKAIRSVTTISLKKTPASKLPTFRLSILIAFGPANRLASIDGGQVTQSLRNQALAYPPGCTDLINCGWIPSLRPPPSLELHSLCEQYGLPEPSAISDEEDMSDSVSESRVPSDFDGLLAMLRDQHREVWRKGKAQFGMLNNDDENINDDVLALLQRHEIADRTVQDLDVVAAVETLCSDLDREPVVEDTSQ